MQTSNMFEHLSGQLQGQQLSESMFKSMAPALHATPEEMEAERERIQYKKHIQLVSHSVELYDMHDVKQRARYEKKMLELILGVQARTHVIWANDRQVLAVDGGQRWFRYLEWSEYKLDVEAVAPVGVDNGKESPA